MSSILKQTTIGELVFDKRELYQVEATDTIEHALQVLKEHNILSAPAWDRSKSQYVGMVDVWSIMTQFALCTFWTDKIETLNTTYERIEPGLFKRATVKDLLEQSPESKVICIADPIESVSILLEPMGDKGVRSCLVSQPDDHTRGPTYKLLSRTDVVKFIVKNIDKFDQELSKKVLDLGKEMNRSINAKTLVGSAEMTALEIFQKMWQQKVLAVPIVDSNYKVIGTLSASDLRGMTVSKLNLVFLPVMQFLKEMGTFREPVTCTPECTLKDVIQRALQAKVHRLWIVNEDQQPAGVVSLSDILSLLKETPRR